MVTGRTRRSHRNGFSLIELLLVVSLIPIITFVVYSNFVAGISVWKKTQTESPYENLSIFQRKAARDFSQAFLYKGIPFKAEGQSVAFASFVKAVPALGGDSAIGEVTYYYEADKGVLLRREKDLSAIYKEKEGSVSMLLSGLTSFQIEYFYFDKEYKEYRWNDNWPAQEKKLPTAVRLKYSDASGPRAPVFALAAEGIPEGIPS